MSGIKNPEIRADNAVSGLNKESDSILKELFNIKLAMPTSECLSSLILITNKFQKLNQGWNDFYVQVHKTLEKNPLHLRHALMHGIKKNNFIDIQSNRKRIKSQEIILKKCENHWGRSLRKIKGLWQENLIDMESSVKLQKEAIQRVNKNFLNEMKCIEKQLAEILDGPCVPGLRLEGIKNSSDHSRKSSGKSFGNYKTREEDILSNQSAFSLISDDIGSFRSYAKNKANQNSFINQNHHTKSNKSSIIHQNEKIINTHENINKSTGKHITDNQTNSVSYEEIKNALILLKKVNLINNSGNQELLILSEMIKDPEKSSNAELLIQLLDFQNQSNKKSFSNKSKVAKPVKKKPVIFNDMDLEGTSREKFKFIDEKSFNRTILSNENLLSPKNYEEYLDNSFFTDKNSEFNHVKLEDLLNVTSIIDNLGLLSAENSMIQEIDKISPREEPSKLKIDNIYDDFPINTNKKNLKTRQ